MNERKTMSDRTVHATLSDGTEIVRYDRAGKWYEETGEGRRLLTIADAVALAAADFDVSWVAGRPGGAAFDRRFRKAYAEMWRP